MRNVRIRNISENSHFPGIIYAELIDIGETDGKQLIIISTLNYIFQILKDPNREYNCVNAEQNELGDFNIKC